jgi:polar amino acid transport system substrate-binding protein
MERVMKTKRNVIQSVFSLFFVLMFLLTSCSPQAAKQANVKTSVPSMAALDKILAQGYFTYGLEAQYRPFEYRDEKNNIIGYDIDIANEIGKRLGVEARPVDTSWGAVIQSLYDGKFDFILGGMTANGERFKRVDFSVPYMDASSGLIVRKGAGIVERKDLDGKIVAAGEGTPSVAQLETTAEELGIKFNGEIKTFDDDASAYEAMKTNRIDAYASSIVSLLEYAKTAPEFTVIPFKSDKWAAEYSTAAFRKEDIGFRAIFNGLMIAMKEDGTLGKLQEKWFGMKYDVPNVPPTW